MNALNYFLLTEIKAKNISTAETIANICLKPAQYLWNGKKIDFIQENSQKAVQLDFIYNSNEYSWKKTAIMVSLLIPATLLGAIFKTYATYKYHAREDDIFMQKCLKRNVVDTVLTPRGQSEFGEKVKAFIAVLRSTSVWNGHFEDKKKPLFLSEIAVIRLLYEENHPVGKYGWEKHTDPKAIEVNRKILDDIHFLWNLSHINVVDHYAVSLAGKEVRHLKEINPSVAFFQVKNLQFADTVKAKEFFRS